LRLDAITAYNACHWAVLPNGIKKLMSDTILIADDDASVLAALRLLLTSQNFKVVSVTSTDAAVSHVKSTEFAAALIDLNYQKDTTSGREGLALIEQIRELDDQLPIIVMTGYSSVEIAVDAMKLGAADFVQKPWVNERLLNAIRTQIQLRNAFKKGSKLAQENALLKGQIQPSDSPLIAQSEAMQEVLRQVEKLALSDMSILLTGENGTGKSLLANIIHERSNRKENPFIGVNMGAIAESLFESEMFGHVKGAFTDAKDNRIGRFELAESGSIFLDEIANITMAQQSKLLRVLEEKQFEKVGSSKTQLVDVRLISATNAKIDDMIQDNTFRQDLLFRLNTITLHIPALRDRFEDILPLANSFIKRFAEKYNLPTSELSTSAKEALQTYHWPGNIRELAHVIERAMFLSTNQIIEVADLSLSHSQTSTSKALQDQASWQSMSLDEIEKQVILDRLESLDKNPLEVAKSLGLSRSAYYRRLEKYDLT
jgi:DNA-binding NtrC family response regulator